MFDPDGDLSVSSTGDLQIAQGRECLLQDIRDRLETMPGDLFAQSGWGCGVGRLLGFPDTPLNRALAVRYIRYALEAEPRIEDNSISIKPLVFNSEVKRFEIRFRTEKGINMESLVWGLR
ncbi:GPW/gp25 family protein [bacterium]|nr:GPW/gp25 family protein [bacterium]